MTLANAVREIITVDLPIQDSINRKYANLAAVARIIKPGVQELVGSPVRLSSLVTTLKRLKLAHTLGLKALKVIAGSTIAVRADISKIVFNRTPSSIEALGKALENGLRGFHEIVLGSDSITLLYDEESKSVMAPLLQQSGGHPKECSVVSVHSPAEIANTPGCIIMIYNEVARRGINIEDTISCGQETMLVVERGQIAPTMNALTRLISVSKKNLKAHQR
ncbi:MAG: hypothetical protein QW767_00485 [Thermoprotei archaeon]